MTNKEIVARLAELGEKASVKERKAVLEEKLAKAEAKATMNTQDQETKEEETMKEQETRVQEQNTQEVTSTKSVNKREAQAAERDAHIDLVVDTIDKALKGNAEADVYPNLGDWIKIKLGGKTVLEARFGKKDLRVQAAEDVAKEAGVTYKLVMSFSKPATIFLQYDAGGMDQLEALIGAADTVAAEKQAEKAAKEEEKRLAKEAAKAEEKARKAEEKEAAKKAKAEAKKTEEPKAE